MGGADTKVELLLHKGGQQEIMGDKWRSEKDKSRVGRIITGRTVMLEKMEIREVRGEGCCKESKMREDEGLKEEDE